MARGARVTPALPRVASLALAVAAVAATPGVSAGAYPFASYDQSPLALIHGLPDSGAVGLDGPGGGDGRTGFDLVVDLTNTLNEQRRGEESLRVDAELYRFNLRAAWRLDSAWRAQVAVPFVALAEGRMDAFIDDFHTLFGFPDGGRRRAPRNRLLLRYDRGGETLLDLREPHSGVGDLRLALGRELGRGGADLVAWGQLKLPSGDPERLTGSGAADAALWLAARARPASRWAVSASAGLLVMGNGDVLGAVQRDRAWFASAGGEFLWREGFALQLELAAHSALYDSGLRLLGEAVQIASGGWVRLPGGSLLQLAVIEDVYVGSAPDVTFHLAWRDLYR